MQSSAQIRGQAFRTVRPRERFGQEYLSALPCAAVAARFKRRPLPLYKLLYRVMDLAAAAITAEDLLKTLCRGWRAICKRRVTGVAMRTGAH